MSCSGYWTMTPWLPGKGKPSLRLLRCCPSLSMSQSTAKAHPPKLSLLLLKVTRGKVTGTTPGQTKGTT